VVSTIQVPSSVWSAAAVEAGAVADASMLGASGASELKKTNQTSPAAMAIFVPRREGCSG
jgi:hypothetical protein